MDTALLMVSVYMLGLLALVWYVGRNDDREGFLIAGRDRGTFQILCSKLSATIGAAWLLTYTSFGFKFGVSMFYALAGYTVGHLLFAWLAVPPIWKWGRHIKALTMGELVKFRTQSAVAASLLNKLVVLIAFLWAAVSLTGGAKILEYLGVPGGFEMGIIITSVFTLVYLLFSGFRGVILTDVLQAFVILAFAVLITVLFFDKPDVMVAMAQKSDMVDVGLAVGLTIAGLGFFVGAERYQLVYAAKSIRSAQWGMALPIVFVLALALLLIVIGQYARFIDPSTSPDLAFAVVLMEYLPMWLTPFALTLFLAAIMSSVDSQVYVVASHACNVKSANHPRKRMRVAIVLTVLSMAVVSFLMKSVVNLSVLGVIVTLVGALPMIYVLVGGRSPYPFISSLLLGAVSAVLGLIFLGIEPVVVAVVVLVSAIGLGLGKLLSLKYSENK